MRLPGRLKSTTLGDLLGTLHRSSATGTLELVELHGRVHRIHVAAGLVTAVELDRAVASLAELLRREDGIDEDTIRRSLLRAMASRRLHGEVLVREFRIAPEVVDRALRRQLALRLHVIEQLTDAQLFFRVTVRPPRGALVSEPLAPGDFLKGRRRARDRVVTPPPPRYSPHADPSRQAAWTTLGIEPGVAQIEIKRAYRRLARTCHPDLHPTATAAERRALEERFRHVTAAYQALVA